jgi:cell division protein FtsN
VKFDFYHILPEMELVIPKEEAVMVEKAEIAATQYFVQVGSFKNSADAESRRAELFLLNFQPSIQTVTIDGKQSWHRVRLGPFMDQRKLDLTQRQLHDNNIEFITLKERK